MLNINKLKLLNFVPKMSTIYSKKSFERFGDDLCEYVFSFITFEDSFRLRCVSKQWKHLIFNKQKHLTIDKSFETYNVKKLEVIFANCLNIKSIDFNVSSGHKSFIFGYITGNTDLNLTKIRFNVKFLKRHIIKEFFEKFGNKIKSIELRGDQNDNQFILQLCPNVTDLKTISLKSCFYRIYGNYRRFGLNSDELKSISFQFKSSYNTYYTDCRRIDEIIKRNENSLQSFEVKYKNNVKLKELNLLSTSISKLTNLKSLSILYIKPKRTTGNIMNPFNDLPIILNLLNEVSNNCKLLKKIQLKFDSNNNELISKLFQTINKFEDLKVLSVDLFSRLIDANLVITSNELNNCKNLTHLSLKINSPQIVITDSFFVSIEEHLPKLQKIEFNCNTNLTQQSFHSLSELKSIQIIKFNSNKSRDQKFKLQSKVSVIKNLMKNCRKIESISINEWSKNKLELMDK